MKVVQLPPGAVWFLNELWAGEADLSESLAAFQVDCEGARNWLDTESAYTLHDQESRLFENIDFLWGRVEDLVEEGARERLLAELPALLYEAALLMEKVTRERDRGHFSPLPAVNRMLLAGAAWIEHRGSRRAVSSRLAILEEFTRNLERMFLRLRSDLPREYRPDVGKGMSHLKAGTEAASRALADDEREALQAALSQIHAGASLVQYLLDRDRREMELLAEIFRRFNIPVVGPQLESELEAAQRAPRERWAGPVETTLSVSLPELEAFWDSVLTTLLLPPGRRQPLLAAVEDGIAGLYAAYRTLLDPDCSDAEGIEILEQSLLAASSAFTEVQDAVLKVDGLSGTLAHAYVEAIRGVMGGTVPDLTLASMVADDPPPGGAAVRGLLLDYLEGGHPDLLCQAVEIMLDGLPRASAEAELECPLCGTANSTSAELCAGCGGRLSLTGQTWEV